MKLPTVKERKRFSSPAITPQALAWDGKQLWISSRDLGFLYKVRAGLAVTTISAAGIDAMEIVEEVDPPGIDASGADGCYCQSGSDLVKKAEVARAYPKLFAIPRQRLRRDRGRRKALSLFDCRKFHYAETISLRLLA